MYGYTIKNVCFRDWEQKLLILNADQLYTEPILYMSQIVMTHFIGNIF